jgi:hypothetical protein
MKIIAVKGHYVYAIHDDHSFIFNMNNIKWKMDPIGYYLTGDGCSYKVTLESVYGDVFMNELIDRSLREFKDEASDSDKD